MKMALITSILVAVFISATSSFSQLDSMPPYEKEKVVTVTGIVEQIYVSSPPMTNKKGIHINLKTNAGIYMVHVCPEWYWDTHSKLFNFEKQHTLTVSGAQFVSGLTANNIYATTIINQSSPLKVNLREPETGRGIWKKEKNLEKQFQSKRPKRTL
ncbi:MAG: hypothetical protein D3923_09855 [Candidatus Electrothrix sp. AR3]|nr:hypothetical protein [Candidatus Electrothrix sp. AR3]